MTKDNISGVTSPSGLTFVGLNSKIVIRDKDGSFLITKYKNPNKNSKNIPFVRGFFKLYNALKMVFGTWLGKIAIIFMCFGIITFFLGLIFDTGTMTEPETFNLNIINIIILIFVLGYTIYIRNLHGLEHKIINTYNKGLELTLQNVKNQSKETPSCGGTLLGIILVMFYVWNYVFYMPGFLLWILVPSLGFEAFLFAKGTKWYNKLFFVPGYLIQLITTGNNVPDKKIEQYLIAFKAFLVQENSKN